MIDKELLEAAAKAAGIEYDAGGSFPKDRAHKFFGLWLTIHGEPYEGQRRRWNPLTDDGDALRLAVSLNLDIEQQHDCVYANGFDPIQNYQLLEWHGDDRCVATRKAIVCAAAQIGAAT